MVVTSFTFLPFSPLFIIFPTFLPSFFFFLYFPLPSLVFVRDLSFPFRQYFKFRLPNGGFYIAFFYFFSSSFLSYLFFLHSLLSVAVLCCTYRYHQLQERHLRVRNAEEILADEIMTGLSFKVNWPMSHCLSNSQTRRKMFRSILRIHIPLHIQTDTGPGAGHPGLRFLSRHKVTS